MTEETVAELLPGEAWKKAFVLLCVASGVLIDLWAIKQIPHRTLPVLCALATVLDAVERTPNDCLPPLAGGTPSTSTTLRTRAYGSRKDLSPLFFPATITSPPCLGRKPPARATVTAGVTLSTCVPFWDPTPAQAAASSSSVVFESAVFPAVPQAFVGKCSLAHSFPKLPGLRHSLHPRHPC